MMKKEKRLFTFKSAAFHITFLAAVVLLSIFPIALVFDEYRLSVIIIEGVIFALLTIFIIVEVVFLIYYEQKERQSIEFRFVKQFLGEHKFREIMFTPIATLFSTLFALTHYAVFLITDLWYFAALCIFYLLGIALKVYQVHVDDAPDDKSYNRGVWVSNSLSLVLCGLFILTIFGTNYFKDELHEPTFLFVLDITFFILKFVFAIIGLVGTIKEKNVLMLSHCLISFVLTFYTGYAIVISILHMNHVLTSENIFSVGLPLSIIPFILSLILFLNCPKLVKK